MFKPDYKTLYYQMKARCDRQQSEIEKLKTRLAKSSRIREVESDFDTDGEVLMLVPKEIRDLIKGVMV